MSIDISGLDKAEVLSALFNASQQQGLGFLDGRGRYGLVVEDARTIIEQQGLNFDYLHGRVMKVDLSGDSFNERLFDRDNGEGAAANAIASLRISKAR